MAYGNKDQYEKAERFYINNTVDTGHFPWYSYDTVNRQNQSNALLVTNTSGVGISFNAYSLGEQVSGITNEILFSENIRSGITTGALRWITYSATHPVVNGSVYSNIVMPDGTTNGVMIQTVLSANNGIYFGFPSSSFLEKGKIYTFSVWMACDNREGYPSTTTARISTYTVGATSGFSPDFTVTTTPRRVFHTFVASNSTTNTFENIAIGNGSGTPPVARLVFWGAQLIEGNTLGTYTPTAQQWNGIGTGIGTATVARGSGAGVNRIYDTTLTVPANSTTLVNQSFFTIATKNDQNIASPSGLQVYGLY